MYLIEIPSWIVTTITGLSGIGIGGIIIALIYKGRMRGIDRARADKLRAEAFSIESKAKIDIAAEALDQLRLYREELNSTLRELDMTDTKLSNARRDAERYQRELSKAAAEAETYKRMYLDMEIECEKHKAVCHELNEKVKAMELKLQKYKD